MGLKPRLFVANFPDGVILAWGDWTHGYGVRVASAFGLPLSLVTQSPHHIYGGARVSPKDFFIDFRVPRTSRELARHIGITPEALELLTDNDKKIRLFNCHKLPKRNSHRLGEFRTVWEAPERCADIYKGFARRFDIFLRAVDPRFPHPRAFGYVRGKSTIDNAALHCGAQRILHADIKDFFPSIRKETLSNAFEALSINRWAAESISEFVTVNDTLPLGIHPSPTLANFICLEMDDELAVLANNIGCAYSRYADDITFSTNGDLPGKDQITAILNSHGFDLCERKFRISKNGQAHYVTGLSVSDCVRPHAPSGMKRRLRQELYYCKKFGIREHIKYIVGSSALLRQREINRIDGTIKYISHIEKPIKRSMRQEWLELTAIMHRADARPYGQPDNSPSGCAWA